MLYYIVTNKKDMYMSNFFKIYFQNVSRFFSHKKSDISTSFEKRNRIGTVLY